MNTAELTEIAKAECKKVAAEWLASDRTAKLGDLHVQARKNFEACALELGATNHEIEWVDIRGLSIKAINGVLKDHYHERVSRNDVPFYKVHKALVAGEDR